MKHYRRILLVLAAAVSAFSYGGTFNVTNPTNGDWLSGNKTLSFNGKGAKVEVTVSAVITGPNGSTTVTTSVNPDVNGDFNGTLALTFAQNAAQGDYTIQVTPTEPGGTYTPVNLNVKLDTKVPKLLDFRPVQNSFVKGNVPIRFRLLEDNPKDWRVTVGGSDIPNNTGTTQTDFSLTWDSSTVENDGPQTIALTAKDQADNPLNFSIPITLDRRPPVAKIQYPDASTRVLVRSDLNIIVDFTDQFANALGITGVDVIIQRTDGTFITRVSRVSFADAGSNTWRYTGRLRWRSGLPNVYKVIATGVDKAGNVAVRQEVLVRTSS